MLLDISMPDRSGIDVLKQLKKEMPKLVVLMLTMHREDQYAIRSLKAGAAGYLTKQSAPAELVNAIRQVAAGRKYISPTLAQELVNQVTVGTVNFNPIETGFDGVGCTLAILLHHLLNFFLLQLGYEPL